MKKIRVLVVGLGTMGLSHARAYKSIKGFEIAGLCSRSVATHDDIRNEFPGVPLFQTTPKPSSPLSPTPYQSTPGPIPMPPMPSWH